MGSSFHADHPGLALPGLSGDPAAAGTCLHDGAIGPNGRSRRAVAAVAPTAIELESAMVASSDQFNQAQLARVTSVLRTAHGHETSLDWAGVEVRVMGTGNTPNEGELVRPRVTAARVFAGTPPQRSTVAA